MSSSSLAVHQARSRSEGNGAIVRTHYDNLGEDHHHSDNIGDASSFQEQLARHVHKVQGKSRSSKYSGVSKSRSKRGGWDAKAYELKKVSSLGRWETEEEAARAVDVANLKLYAKLKDAGRILRLNFPVSYYSEAEQRGEAPLMLPKQAPLPSRRVNESGRRKYRGVLADIPYKYRKNGSHYDPNNPVPANQMRYRAYMSIENTMLYLGLYSTEEKAARIYDIATMRFRPKQTWRLNFPLADYNEEERKGECAELNELLDKKMRDKKHGKQFTLLIEKVEQNLKARMLREERDVVNAKLKKARTQSKGKKKAKRRRVTAGSPASAPVSGLAGIGTQASAAAMRELQDENKALREALERARATIAAQGDPDSDSSDSDYDPDDLASMDETLKNKTTL